MGNNIKFKLLIIFQCLLFGFSFIAIKNLCLLNVPTFLIISVRFLIGAVTLFLASRLMIVFNKEKKETEKAHFKKEELIYGCIAGIVMFIAFAFQTFGAETTTPAKNALFTDLCIVITPIISSTLHKKLALQPFMASLIAIVGVLVVLQIFQDKSIFCLGDILSIICGVAFSIHFLLLEKFARNSKHKLDAFNFTVVQLAVTAILSIIFSLIFETNNYADIDWGRSIGWFLYVGVFSSAVAYVLQFVAQAHISANDTALLNSFEAVFTLVFALIFNLDVFSWNLIIGAGIILTAFILSSIDLTKFRRKKDETTERDDS